MVLYWTRYVGELVFDLAFVSDPRWIFSYVICMAWSNNCLGELNVVLLSGHTLEHVVMPLCRRVVIVQINKSMTTNMFLLQSLLRGLRVIPLLFWKSRRTRINKSLTESRLHRFVSS